METRWPGREVGHQSVDSGGGHTKVLVELKVTQVANTLGLKADLGR